MVYKFFDKKSALLNKSSGSGIVNEPNYQLENKLHKPLIKKLKKRKFYSFFRDNIWNVDLADMESLSKYNKENKYLLCAIDLFSKYVWVLSIEHKKGTSIVNPFKKIIWKGQRKQIKYELTKVANFIIILLKIFLKINNIEIHWTYNEGKSVGAERFIRTLKNKIFKHMIDISKNVYSDVLHEIVNKYNNTVHRTIEMKSIDVTDDSYAECNENFNKKDPKFKVGDHVRISLDLCY